MVSTVADLIARTIDRLVRLVVVPVTGVIPVLAERGILFAVFGAMWLAFASAVVVNPGAIDQVWQSIGQLPLPLQAVAWLLFLPLMAGLWIFGTDWPFVVRVVLIAAIGAWNLLVFLPRRGQASVAPVQP